MLLRLGHDIVDQGFAGKVVVQDGLRGDEMRIEHREFSAQPLGVGGELGPAALVNRGQLLLDYLSTVYGLVFIVCVYLMCLCCYVFKLCVIVLV